MVLSPSISVIIPTYNRGNTLPHAVDSVRQQTFQDLEIIVVDDCSSKPVADSLAESAAFDPRLKIIRHEHNLGQAAARNTGASHAQGQWLAFLDDDDLYYPEKLSRQLAYMDQKKLGVSVTDFTLPGDQHLYNFRNSEHDPTWLILTGRFLALPSTMLIDKKLFNEMGGFDQDPKVRRTEDLDFALRLYQNGHTLAVMPEFLSHYSGFHAAKPEFEMNALRGIEQKHRHLFAQGSGAARLFEVAMRWKKAHIELGKEPQMAGSIKLASLAFQYPIQFAKLAVSIVGNPIHRLFPPPDRPKRGIPLDGTLSFPYIPY